MLTSPIVGNGDLAAKTLLLLFYLGTNYECFASLLDGPGHTCEDFYAVHLA